MILMYHKIYPESPTMWWVQPDAFWRQLEELRRYQVVYLDEYDPENPKQAVITFDGVYENIFTYALPILKKFGYPFELFMVGNTVGKGNEFDQPVEPPARFASEDQLKKMVQGGGRLQWHSRMHGDLTRTQNIHNLEMELTIPSHFKKLDPKGFRWFAYPHGKHTEKLIQQVKRSFYGALSCDAGNNQDRYQLNRVTVINDTKFERTKVSLIIPNYNYGHLLAEAIESVLRQTVCPNEILFIDDCSQDNSMEIAERYRGKVKIVKNEKNLGIIENFNKAISLTQGDYICFLGADNRFRSDYVEKCKQALDSHPDCAIAYTNVLLFGPMAELWARRFGARPLPEIPGFFLWEFPAFSEEVRRTLRHRNVIHGSSMYRRSAFEQVGRYRDSSGPEDQNLFARILEQGWNAVLCQDYLLEYRHHSNRQDCTQRLSAMEVANLRRQLVAKDAHIRQLTLNLHGYQKEIQKGKESPAVNSISKQTNAKKESLPKTILPRVIAFYLPQFHPIPENDVWWGKGFTEWTNVAKARPLFPGHYQPHVTADLGFYDLRLPEARKAQADLAREHGIHGLCYYHYWFHGKLLLERPIQEVLKTGEPDFPFCLCWANEDWTRAWDGRSSDVLVKQEYDLEDDRQHIQYLLQIFKDPRYIRIKGKPLFLVYRPSKLPDPIKTTAIWREEAHRFGVGELHLCQVERFPEDMRDPSRIGFDAAVEFQPDGVNLGPPLSDGKYGGNTVFSYEALVRASLSKPNPEYRRYPCVTPSWDNSPRKEENAVIFIDGTPQLYEEWIRTIIGRQKDCEPGENLIFINAMNEWGEGCHLEPDLRLGRAYLEATKRALGLEDQKFLSNPLSAHGRLLPKREKPVTYLRTPLTGKEIPRIRPFVSIIIPVFNKVEFTKRCIAAIRKTTPGNLYEIIIVNNGSTDETASYLNSLDGEVKVVTNSMNQGFAVACNQGARLASNDYLLFLNNDTEPFSRWVEPLVEVLNRDPEVASVGSKLLFSENSIQHAGVIIIEDKKIKDPLVARHIYYRQPSDLPEANQIRTYQALTAACLLVRKTAFEDVRGFDEQYWNGYEDIDLCFKLQEKGWKLVYNPESVLIHHESASGPERFSKIPENINLLHQKWLGKVKPDLVVEENGAVKKAKMEKIKAYRVAEACFSGDVFAPIKIEKDMVSIVILTFNQLEFTRKCVQSIQRHTPEKYELIFVDNGSTDGTKKWLRKQIRGNHNYRFIENKANLGFATGCNQGIEAARGGYLLLLNNDVVVSPNWLSGMLECLDRTPDIGIVGPMTNQISGIQKIPDAPYQSINNLDEFAYSFHEKYRHRQIPSRRIVGFCMLFRRELVERIGLLDENFGTGNFEDDDFCLRAELEGYSNMIAGDVFIHHYGSRSFIGNQIDYRSSMGGNRKIFFDKWKGIDYKSPLGRKLLSLQEKEEAWKLYHQDQTEKSAEKFLTALKISPQDEDIYLSFSEMCIDAKRYQEAFDLLKQMPQEEKNALKYALMGYCQENLGKILEADELAEEALSLDPGNHFALNLKGILSYRQGKMQKATGFFQKAIHAASGYGEPYTNLGVMKWEAGEKEEALNWMERGFILSPTSTDILQLYHSAVSESGALTRGHKIFIEAKELYPSHKRIRLLLIDLLLKQEKFDAAMLEIEGLIAYFPLDDGSLKAALEIRKKVGPIEIARNGKKGKVSLCMIVKNEEKNLIKCLPGVKPLVDEMIVVDTGSTDQTKEIATIFGAKVFDFPWTEDFSLARNYSLSQAKGDLIFILDADEVISASDHHFLRNLTAKSDGNLRAFSFITRSYVNRVDLIGFTTNSGVYKEESGMGWTPSEKVRLFPNDRRFQFENPVHEIIRPVLERHKIPVQKCPIPIHHYGKLDSEREKEKGGHYYVLGKKKLESHEDLSSMIELAIQAGTLGKFEEAIELWTQVVRRNPRMPDAYINLSYNYLKTKKFSEAAQFAQRAMELDADSKEALLNYSSAEFFCGNISQTISFLEKFLPRVPEYPPILGLLSLAYFLDGKKANSLSLIEKLDKMGFNHTEYVLNSAQDLISAGQEENARKLVEIIPKNHKRPLRNADMGIA